jgi:hypothetical protein
MCNVSNKRDQNNKRIKMAIDSTDKSMLIIFLDVTDRVVMDAISHAAVQSGVEIPDITNSFLMASSDDYYASMNAFTNNFYAICSLLRSRICYIDISRLATKYNMSKWMTPAINAMFKTIGVAVMSTYGESCDGTIDTTDIGKFQTNNLNASLNNTFGTRDKVDPMTMITNDNERNRIGKALRSALYSIFKDINSYGATMSDIHTAVINKNNIMLYGMGLGEPLSPYDNWEFDSYDFLDYPEWLETLRELHSDITILENPQEYDVAGLIGKRVIAVSNSRSFFHPNGLKLYMEPYSSNVIMFGYVSEGGVDSSVPNGVIKAWMNRPTGVHNTQARHIVELAIHRVSTQSMCVQLTDMEEIPIRSLVTSPYSAYAMDDRYIVLHKDQSLDVSNVEWFANSWDRDWNSSEM